MPGRIIEVQAPGQHLSVQRGFLIIRQEGEDKARLPLSDLDAVIIGGTGISLTAHVVQALEEHGALLVFTGKTHHPSHLVWPLAAHHQHHLRLHTQIAASGPLKKRLWQQVVQAKIRHQGQVLETLTGKDEGLQAFVRHVQSGDPDNKEAQAARRYWKPLLGTDFKRDPDGDEVNSLLNYGYAVIRAGMARAVAACGLHPALGIHHANQFNPFCLVDDLMEPFRPAVDYKVHALVQRGDTALTPESKRELVDVFYSDLKTADGASPLTTCMQKLAQSYMASLEAGKPSLVFPLEITPLAQDLLPTF